MSSDGIPGDDSPRFEVISQYVRDLSFENPSAPGALADRPQIDLGVDLAAKRLDSDVYEVELKLRVNAIAEGKPIFLIELAYAGLFRIQNIPADSMQMVLLVQAPHILFPFARRIVADVVRDGGMPPLMIEPIDFMTLYHQKMTQGVQPQVGNA